MKGIQEGQGRAWRARHVHFIIGLGLAFLLPAILAPQEKKSNPVTFTGDVGFVNTAGNTSVTSLNVGNKLTVNAGKGLFTQTAAFVYSKTSGIESANSQALRGRFDYPLASRLAAYAFGGYERNKFAGIAHRLDEDAGLACQVVRAPKDVLDAEAGLGFVQESRYTMPGSSLTASNNFMSARAAVNYKHLFTKTSYVQQVVEYLPNLETSFDYRINSESALVAPISTHIGLKMSYLIRYNNDPPSPGLKKTDRLFTTGLQITY